MPKSKRGKVGRPALTPDKGKRAAIGLRTTPELKERLERIAAATGRSLSQEIEFRLERSLQEDDALRREFGDERTQRILRIMAQAAAAIEDQHGKKWHEDWDTYYAVLASWQRITQLWHPTAPDPLIDGIGKADAKLDKAARALPALRAPVNAAAEQMMLHAIKEDPLLNIRRFLAYAREMLDRASDEQRPELIERIRALENIEKQAEIVLNLLEQNSNRIAAQKKAGDEAAFGASDRALGKE